MPLRDHFHAPWQAEAPWESIGTMWIGNLVRLLNKTLPHDGFRAFMQIHLGHMIEADVAEYANVDRGEYTTDFAVGGLKTAVIPEPILTYEPNFPDEFEIRIKTIKGERKLVAVVEFVSPSNKDREESRSQFLNKCIGYLQLGIGLVLVDTITNRHANFHNELQARIANRRGTLPTDPPIYVASYRPFGYEAVESIDVWPYPLVVGQPVPSVPLPLMNGPELMLDLETTYMQALADHNL